MKNLKAQGRIVLATAVGINFLAGLLYIWSIIKKGLKDQYHWTDTEATLPYTISLIAFVVTMVAIGKLQDMKGPRLTATLSGIFMGAGLILSSLHTDPTLMIITFGIITGAGCGISNVSTVPPAVKWFPPQKKGMVTGIVVAGVALASVFYSPFTNALIGSYGIQRTMLVMGIGILVLVVIMAQFLNNPPAGYVPQGVAVKQNASDQSAEQARHFGEDLNWRQLLKRLDFYKLWIMFAFASAAGLMIIGNVTTITMEQSGSSVGFLLVALLAIFNAVGRFTGGAVADKVNHYTLLVIIFAVASINMLLFSVYNSLFMVSVGFAVPGLCYGAGFAIFPTIIVSNFGVKNYGSNYGLIMTAWGVGGIIGPMVAAAVRDASGTYRNAYFVCCALLAVALLIALFTRLRKVKGEG
ncbi:MAG TPA: oxalate:formate antiporter [Clostridiales bacterium]|nr:oxalate:formate antiporter [Clostridiales bacterium]